MQNAFTTFFTRKWRILVEPSLAGVNCDATYWAEGGRWRRSRHLRRVQRPRQGGSEMISFPYRNRFKFPFLSDYFSENWVVRPSTCSKMRLRKSWTEWQTYKQTESGRSGAAPDQVLDRQNADTARRWLEKLSPNPSLNQAKIPVKEHLRLDSVVALSSSGACHGLVFWLT